MNGIRTLLAGGVLLLAWPFAWISGAASDLAAWLVGVDPDDLT